MMRAAKYLYIIGGCALSMEREPIRQIERIRVEECGKNHVKIIAENCGELELARRSPSCFLTGKNEILIAGGCLGPNNHTDSMEIYSINDQKSRKIEEKLEIGASCSAFDPFSTSPQKPIIGGFESHSCLDDIQILHEPDFQCSRLPKRALPKIKNSTVIQKNSREFWMFGGWEDERNTSKSVRKIVFNEDFSDFSTEFCGFLPYPVEGHSTVKIGNFVFLIGGFDGITVVDTIVRYNLETKEAEILPEKLAEKRENHVSGLLSGENSGIFLITAGGWNSRSSLSHVEVFHVEFGARGAKLARCQVDGNLNLARNRATSVAVETQTTREIN